MQIVYAGICAAISWAIVCIFFHCDLRTALQGMFMSAVCCVGISYLCTPLPFAVDLSPVVLIPLAFLLPLSTKQPPQTRLLAYLLATGTYCFLSGICHIWITMLGEWIALIPAILASLLLLWIAHANRGFLPPADWEIFFESKSPERFYIHKSYI